MKNIIQYVMGDLITAFKNSDVDMIAHQCNCFSTMGGGIAAVIAKEFPKVAEVDRSSKLPPEKRLGTAVFVKTECGEVVNLYGQFHYGRDKINTDYVALRSALRQMDKVLSICTKRYKVGLPKLGCGLGGGDWDVVANIIQEELIHCDIFVYVV